MNTYQSRTSSQPINQTLQVSTSGQRSNWVGSDLKTEHDAFLRYAVSGDSVVYSGNSDYAVIAALKDSINKLKTEYFSRTGAVTIKNEERADLDKRFLLFEHELDGLLRRRIEFAGKDFEGGSRNLDFTNLLN
jgi:hypothetical protein